MNRSRKMNLTQRLRRSSAIQQSDISLGRLYDSPYLSRWKKYKDLVSCAEIVLYHILLLPHDWLNT